MGTASEIIVKEYSKIIRTKYPNIADRWPIISGYNIINGEFNSTLDLIGFDPWLDEDALNAGAELERGIKQGFTDSCAAVFFVTPNFSDEEYIATEVNYAIGEKRKKKDKFSIITLVFEEKDIKGRVPELLEPYVWKEPKNDLEALREIIKALPLKIGNISYRL